MHFLNWCEIKENYKKKVRSATIIFDNCILLPVTLHMCMYVFIQGMSFVFDRFYLVWGLNQYIYDNSIMNFKVVKQMTSIHVE